MAARVLAALGSGLLFGLGLAISQMVNPAKVLAFLDVTGSWDPSLLLVLAAALGVAMLAFRFILRQPHPVFAPRFSLPTKKAVDARLVSGSILFGIGWGLIGLCPGPAIASLAYGQVESIIFLLPMVLGLGAARLLR